MFTGTQGQVLYDAEAEDELDEEQEENDGWADQDEYHKDGNEVEETELVNGAVIYEAPVERKTLPGDFKAYWDEAGVMDDPEGHFEEEGDIKETLREAFEAGRKSASVFITIEDGNIISIEASEGLEVGVIDFDEEPPNDQIYLDDEQYEGYMSGYEDHEKQRLGGVPDKFKGLTQVEGERF